MVLEYFVDEFLLKFLGLKRFDMLKQRHCTRHQDQQYLLNEFHHLEHEFLVLLVVLAEIGTDDDVADGVVVEVEVEAAAVVLVVVVAKVEVHADVAVDGFSKLVFVFGLVGNVNRFLSILYSANTVSHLNRCS